MNRKERKSRARKPRVLVPDPQPSEHTPQKPAAPRVSLHNFSSATPERFFEREDFDPSAR